VGGPIAGIVKHDPLTLGQSRANGTAALTKRLKELHAACPSAKFAGLGYSQGALILGDVLSSIGNGRGPVPAHRILAAGLDQSLPSPLVSREMRLATLSSLSAALRQLSPSELRRSAGSAPMIL